MPIACSAIASSPAVTCSPEATTASYSRASCIGEASRHHSGVAPGRRPWKVSKCAVPFRAQTKRQGCEL